MRVYLCGPIFGCTDGESKDWREEVTESLRFIDAIKIIDPMRRDYRGKEEESLREIVELDKIDVASCDVILVNYVPDKASFGTAMEVLYAFERGKTVIVVHSKHVKVTPWLWYHSHQRFNDFTASTHYIYNVLRHEMLL